MLGSVRLSYQRKHFEKKINEKAADKLNLLFYSVRWSIIQLFSNRIRLTG